MRQISGQFTELTFKSNCSACGQRQGAAAAELGYSPLQPAALSACSHSLTRLCQNDPGWLTI